MKYSWAGSQSNLQQSFLQKYNTHSGYKCLLLWTPKKTFFNMNQLPADILVTWISSEGLQHSTSGLFPALQTINEPRPPKFFISVCFGISSARSQSTGLPLSNCMWCGLVWNTKLKTGKKVFKKYLHLARGEPVPRNPASHLFIHFTGTEGSLPL